MRVEFKKKKKKKEKRSDSDLSTPREREIRRDRGHGVDGDCLWSSPTRRSARSSTGDYLWVSTFTVSNSKLSPTTVKICDFLLLLFFFFNCWHVHHVGAVSRRVGEAKKKKGTARTPESGESCRYPCLTRVRHQYVAKNGVSVQPSVA